MDQNTDQNTDQNLNMPTDPESNPGGGLKLKTEEPQKTEQPNYNMPQSSEPSMDPFGNMNANSGMNPNQNPFLDPDPFMNSNMGPAVINTPPKKSKKPLIFILCGIALAALIACALIFLPRLFMNERKQVEEAFRGTLQLTDNFTYWEDQVGLKAMGEAFNTTGGTVSFDFTLSSETDEEVNGLGLQGEIIKDVSAKVLSAEGSFTYEEKDILRAVFYGMEEYSYLIVPELMDFYYSIPNKDFLNAFLSSPFAKSHLDGATAVGIPQMDLDFFSQPQENTAEDAEGFFTSQLWQKAQIKYVGKKKTEVCGSSVRAKKFEVRYTQDDIETAIGNLVQQGIDALARNPEYADLMHQYGLSTSMISMYQSEIMALVKGMITEDLIIYVYVKDGKVCKAEASYPISVYGMAITPSFYFEMYDGDIDASVGLNMMGSAASITFTFDRDGDNIVGNIQTDMSGRGSKVDFSIVREGATEHGKISFSDEDLSIDWTAQLKDVTKGVAFTWALDNMTLTHNGQKELEASGELTVDTSKHEPLAFDDSKKQYDLSTITQDEIDEIENSKEYKDRVKAWKERLRKEMPNIADKLEESEQRVE